MQNFSQKICYVDFKNFKASQQWRNTSNNQIIKTSAKYRDIINIPVSVAFK